MSGFVALSSLPLTEENVLAVSAQEDVKLPLRLFVARDLEQAAADVVGTGAIGRALIVVDRGFEAGKWGVERMA